MSDEPFDIRINGGAPSDEEIAAITAVLSATLEELAADPGRRRPVQTAWARSQRSPRTPIAPGTWNEFAG